MSNDLVFVGYREGLSKKEKKYYVLSFITYPTSTKDGNCVYSTNVDIFVDVDKYNQFIKENNLMSIVNVPYNIFGDKVRYYL